MRPNTGYSTLYWITKDKMARRKAEMDNVEPEVLPEPELIPEGTADLNFNIDDIIENEEEVLDFEEEIDIKIKVEDEVETSQKFEIQKIYRREKES